jgi:hypothetical protein
LKPKGAAAIIRPVNNPVEDYSMTFEESYKLMGREESFRATVYAMNTLLIKKGFYTGEEFEQLFCEHAINFMRSFSPRTPEAHV